MRNFHDFPRLSAYCEKNQLPDFFVKIENFDPTCFLQRFKLSNYYINRKFLLNWSGRFFAKFSKLVNFFDLFLLRAI